MTNDDDAARSSTSPDRRDRDELRSGDRAERTAPTRRRGGWLRETAIVVISALVLSVLIKTFLAQAFYIPSGSMEDTLAVGDRVLVSKLTPAPLDVNRGDLVVFVDPGGWLDPAPDNRSSGSSRAASTLTATPAASASCGSASTAAPRATSARAARTATRTAGVGTGPAALPS